MGKETRSASLETTPGMMAPMTTEVSASPLRIEQEGHVQTWTIDLPEQRNPITGLDVIEALEGAVTAANDAAQDLSLIHI